MRLGARLLPIVAVAACTPAPPPETSDGVTSSVVAPTPAPTPSTSTPAISTGGAAGGGAPAPSSIAEPESPCRDPFSQRWQFARESAKAHEHVKAWAWLDGETHDRLLVGPDEVGHQDARCYASGPHRGLNVANWCCRHSSPLGVRALRKSAPLEPGAVLVLRGQVVKRYRCPACPKGAQCKPCMGDNLVLSDDAERHESYDLDDGDTIVFTDDPDRFELGATVTVAVAVLPSAQSNGPLNDLLLLAWR